MFRDNIYQNCVSLGTLRVLCLNKAFEAYWSGDNGHAAGVFEELDESVEGVLIIASSLGIEIRSIEIFPTVADGDLTINPIIEAVLFDDKIRETIVEAYGVRYAFAFSLAQFLTLTRMLSSLTSQLSLRGVREDRKPIIRRDIQLSNQFIKHFGEFLHENIDSIGHIFGVEFADEASNLADIIDAGSPTMAWAKTVNNATEELINQLLPHYPDISERLKRGKELRRELMECLPGVEHWKDYENVCLKILRYLFLPPFNQVKIQARSVGNLERRDAILPNNQHSGFWHLIRSEFESRHIVCEFKNGASGGQKNSLNQLRIYLSKPTIGRFGLLFVRSSPSSSLLQAQRDAYEQSRILILILDDKKLIKLLKARAYLGEVDEFLNNEKVNFEISY